MRWTVLAAVTAVFLPRAGADPFRQVLTSVERNIDIESWGIEARDLTPDCPHPWSVRKYRPRGGKQEGVDAVVPENGKLSMLVVPTRGMGIWWVRMGDVRLGWDSPVREIVHPKLVNLAARGGLGWLDGFAEWMCRCGLESNGHPGEDTIIDNTGAEATVELTLHGKVAYLPAQEVEIIIEREPPYRIRLLGLVAERMMHGPKLDLRTEISTEAGSNTFRVTDVITNGAAFPTEFQIIYHSNFGTPLLEEGAAFVGPVQRVTPFNDHAAKGIERFSGYSGPSPGYVEKVYCVRPYGDEDRNTAVLLQNRAADRAVSMAYSLRALPYLTIWKNTAAEADGYVTGIEPGTNFPYARRLERKAGRVPKLAQGEQRRFELEVAIHVGREGVARVRERIKAIQGGRPTQLDSKPSPGEP